MKHDKALKKKPLAQLVAKLRHLYSGLRATQTDSDVLSRKQARQTPRDSSSIQAAENEGMSKRADQNAPKTRHQRQIPIHHSAHPGD
ncbi:hypothetical protein [Defluviimonas salinarum]|uniref:Uncharacterized protein n=1 Tax=Defluviimonas salinarum TaxID=2992147 RepID=A0ABT3JAD0_9RHOB|nr:hypothetical protein [Defluviimonas salinarum]MCW3784631.1 hypothetical protein [Defluviimonas salinarum]